MSDVSACVFLCRRTDCLGQCGVDLKYEMLVLIFYKLITFLLSYLSLGGYIISALKHAELLKKAIYSSFAF